MKGQSQPLPVLMKQFARFFVIGIINTVVDLLVLNVETLLTGYKDGMYYALQKGISFLCAVLCSYVLNKYWAFEDKSKDREGAKAIRFLVISAGGMAINVTTATVIVTLIRPLAGALLPLDGQLWVNAGALAGSAAGLLWNFAGYKLWVFKK